MYDQTEDYPNKECYECGKPHLNDGDYCGSRSCYIANDL